jgi:hypothetical protein
VYGVPDMTGGRMSWSSGRSDELHALAAEVSVTGPGSKSDTIHSEHV